MDMADDIYGWGSDEAKSCPGNPNPFEHQGYRFLKAGAGVRVFNVRCACQGSQLPRGAGDAVGPGDDDDT